jgi:hypothetical protein
MASVPAFFSPSAFPFTSPPLPNYIYEAVDVIGIMALADFFSWFSSSETCMCKLLMLASVRKAHILSGIFPLAEYQGYSALYEIGFNKFGVDRKNWIEIVW